MPANQGVGLDDDDRGAPVLEQARAQKEPEAIHQVQSRSLTPAPKDAQLVTKDRIFDDQVSPRPTEIPASRGEFARRWTGIQGRPSASDHAPRPCGDAGD